MKKGTDFNWGKKISLKEIAQFYEDKLREEDAKLQYLNNQISRLDNNVAELNHDINANKDIWEQMKNEISYSAARYFIDNGYKIIDDYIETKLSTFHDDIIRSVHNELLKDLKEFGDDINLQRKIYVSLIGTSKGLVQFKTPFEFMAIMDPWQHGNMYVNDAFLGIYAVASKWDDLIFQVRHGVSVQYEKIVLGKDPCNATGDISAIKEQFLRHIRGENNE